MGPVLEGVLLQILERVLTDEVAAQAKGQLEGLVAQAKADGMKYVSEMADKTPSKIDDFLVKFVGKVVS